MIYGLIFFSTALHYNIPVGYVPMSQTTCVRNFLVGSKSYTISMNERDPSLWKFADPSVSRQRRAGARPQGARAVNLPLTPCDT
jgi:hypothetical protein